MQVTVNQEVREFRNWHSPLFIFSTILKSYYCFQDEGINIWDSFTHKTPSPIPDHFLTTDRNINCDLVTYSFPAGKDLIDHVMALCSSEYLTFSIVVLNSGKSASLGTGMTISILLAVKSLLNWDLAFIMYFTLLWGYLSMTDSIPMRGFGMMSIQLVGHQLKFTVRWYKRYCSITIKSWQSRFFTALGILGSLYIAIFYYLSFENNRNLTAHENLLLYFFLPPSLKYSCVPCKTRCRNTKTKEMFVP